MGKLELEKKARHPEVHVFLGLVAASLLFASSNGCNGVKGPPPFTEACKQVPIEQLTAPPQTSNQLIVYLDTSLSMAGYISADKGTETIFSKTLRELRNVVTIISNPPLDVQVRSVGTTVGAPSGDIVLSQASISRSMFNGGYNDLAGAISLFSGSEPAQQNGANAAQQPPPPPARFHILVTDGVQSTRNQNTELSCDAGSDQICVRRKILELLNWGWAGAVLGLRSEFDGNIYSEINRVAGRPISIPYRSNPGDPSTFRPFYLYVFSPDPVALTKLVDALKERLRPLIAQPDGLRELALTSAYANGESQAEILIPADAGGLLGQNTRSNARQLILAVDAKTALQGPKTFAIVVNVPWSGDARDSGTAEDLSKLIQWQLVQTYPPAEKKTGHPTIYPDIKIIGQQLDQQGRVVITATAQAPAGRAELDWAGYRLEGRLNLEKQTPAWVRQWSTDLDTSAEMANKTLFLETGMLGLWRNPVLKNQLVVEICLLAGPK